LFRFGSVLVTTRDFVVALLLVLVGMSFFGAGDNASRVIILLAAAGALVGYRTTKRRPTWGKTFWPCVGLSYAGAIVGSKVSTGRVGFGLSYGLVAAVLLGAAAALIAAKPKATE
jgi:hypothetical protein